MARILKPATVLRKWSQLCDKVKKDKTKRQAPGKAEARRHAAMCGMKSMLEVEVAAHLDALKIPWKYESEVLEYVHEPQKYNPDFVLEDGSKIEVKGKMTAEVRKKLKSIKRCNPDERIGIAFGKPNNKLSARPNSTRYHKWASDQGYPNSGVTREEIKRLLKEIGCLI